MQATASSPSRLTPWTAVLSELEMPRNAKIVIRNGTTVPSAGDFDVAEPAWDKSSGKLYVKNAAGSMVEIGSLADGDKGDITVSASGATWTIDNGAVGTAKLGGDITTAGKALLDDADAAAQRTTLGLGTLATQNGTFSGTSSGTNTGDQTITLTGDVTGSGTGSFAATIASGAITDAKVAANAAISGSKLQAASTTNAGAVQLTDSTSSTSTTTAATPNSVKSAYDLANAALPKAGGTLTGDVTLNAQSDLRFADSDSSNWVALQAPATVASNVTWTLPNADGTANQVLKTNGAGALGWTNPGGTPPNILYLTSGTSATYTPTTGTKAIYVEIAGGGGGGGGVDGQGTGTSAAAGSGGGGAYVAKLITNMSQTFTYTIGAGGTGGSAGANSGTAGGTTTFVASVTGTLTASGGGGGIGRTATSSNTSIAGGAGGTTFTGGDLGLKGGSATCATTSGVFVASFSTAGCAPYFGTVGDSNNGNAGNNGVNYGEGGSAATISASTTNYAGGNGVAGIIRITEFL